MQAFLASLDAGASLWTNPNIKLNQHSDKKKALWDPPWSNKNAQSLFSAINLCVCSSVMKTTQIPTSYNCITLHYITKAQSLKLVFSSGHQNLVYESMMAWPYGNWWSLIILWSWVPQVLILKWNQDTSTSFSWIQEFLGSGFHISAWESASAPRGSLWLTPVGFCGDPGE